MKRTLYFALAATLLIFACRKPHQPEPPADDASTRTFNTAAVNAVTEYSSAKPTDTLKGIYTTPLILDNSKIWYLDGLVRIKGTTCTIAPGTIIAGLNPQTANGINPGMLVIEKDAQIAAKGTADQPIIFTSKYMVDGNALTTPAPGDFGGLIIMGNSFAYSYRRKMYLPEKGLGEPPVEIECGGADDTLSSGELQFVRVEYGGFKFKADNPPPVKPYDDIDGIVFASVGSKTFIDHVESANSKTNSFRISGGTLNATYLVDIDHAQNGFIITGGYIGLLTYGISLAGNNQQPNGNGILVGNGWKGERIAASRPTHPIISNYTIAGIDSQPGTYPTLRAAVYVNSTLGYHAITLQRSILLGYDNALDDNDVMYKAPHIFSTAVDNILCNARHYSTRAHADVYLAAEGANKRHMSTINTNSFARLTQPFLRRGNVNLAPLSTSPAYNGTVCLIGAFTDYSRPPSRWGHTRSWFRLYY